MAASKQTARAKKRSPSVIPAVGELLFEIGTEELPYQFVPLALTSLRESAERLLKEHRLAQEQMRVLGTPRRLTLIVESLTARQAPTVKEVMGPSKTVAYDASGNPTRALLGFMAGQQIEQHDLEVRQTPKGEYVCAVKRDPGRPTGEVLADLLPQLIDSLSFPKSMRWNETGVKFARPIRWLVALYAGRVIKFQVAGVAADNRTWGHRFLTGSGRSSRQGVLVKDVKSYLKVLEQHGVVPDPDTRRAMILTQLEALAKSAHGSLHPDEDLLVQAIYTVENPQAILGRFNPEYLAVPKEVLMTAMKEHQGFFSLVKKDGSLVPAFISVTNMKLRDMRLIQEGNERVLAARLADAKFFFDEDRKMKLIDRVDKLKGMTFHQKLGTLYQKTERMMKLADKLADILGHRESCQRAAQLSKADLLTGIVGEFPTLQGVMGGEYARHDGEHVEVSAAIAEQYLPRAMESELPKTAVGTMLSLADRLDTITAFFHVGMVPTGSEDPLGLRRHALSVIRLILEGGLDPDLVEVVRYAKELVARQGFTAAGGADPVEFMADRLRYYVRTIHSFREDVVEAVVKPALLSARGGTFHLVDLLARMKAVQAVTTRTEFDPLMVGFKRAHRLVEKEKWTQEEVDPALFQHAAESELANMLFEVKTLLPGFLAASDYEKALNALVRMKPVIDNFFNGVLVNAEDERLRANRLSLLCAVDRLFSRVADFSQISVQGA
ncbi:MAG TPA: glycine--tRNA ligase subunit beta [Nitrospiraceae bacterium]|nr:glycine--tRNA ligase subunit beta [Nitrospiraceae bacterium]